MSRGAKGLAAAISAAIRTVFHPDLQKHRRRGNSALITGGLRSTRRSIGWRSAAHSRSSRQHAPRPRPRRAGRQGGAHSTAKGGSICVFIPLFIPIVNIHTHFADPPTPSHRLRKAYVQRMYDESPPESPARSLASVPSEPKSRGLAGPR